MFLPTWAITAMFRMPSIAVPSADVVVGFSATADMNNGAALVVVVAIPKAFDWHVVVRGTKAVVERTLAKSSTAETKEEVGPIMMSILSCRCESRKNL